MGNGGSANKDETSPPAIPSSSSSRRESEEGEGDRKRTNEGVDKPGMFQMASEGYEMLVKAIVRPPRATYSIADLGPSVFNISGFMFTRLDVRIKNERGLTLQCSWWRPMKPRAKTSPCVICLHGNASCRAGALENLSPLLTTGITVFAFDFAGSGLSEGEYVSLGYLEQEDLKAVIAYLRASGKVSTIGLWGRSMGAATALLYAHRDPSIAGMVLDSSFADMYQLCREMVRFAEKQGWHVPGFMMAGAIRILRGSVMKRVKGFDIYKLKPIENVSKAFVPALFVHGKQDDFILPSHSEALHKAYAGEANITLVEGDHNSPRPRFMRDAAAIFLKQALRVPDSYAIPTQGLGFDSHYPSHLHQTRTVRQDALRSQEDAMIAEAIRLSLQSATPSSSTAAEQHQNDARPDVRAGDDRADDEKDEKDAPPLPAPFHSE